MGNEIKLMYKSIIHVLMSDYDTDSRVNNETVSLAKEGYDITVSSVWVQVDTQGSL